MVKARALRWLAAVVLVLLVLVLLAWLALPPLLKWQLETRGTQLLGREVRVGDVRFAPLTLALTLNDLSIGAAAGAAEPGPQLQLQRLFVDLDARSLLRLAPVVEALEIDQPRLRVARVADGHYDFDDLLQRFDKPPQPDAEPARFAVYNLRLSGGEVTFDDRPVARRHELRRLELGLPFLSNLPDHLQIKVEPQLSFVLNGSEFETRGRSTPFAEGRASAFDIRFEGLDLSRWWAYAPKGLPLQPVGGKLWADLSLAFEQPRESGPRVELRGSLDLRDFALHTPANTPLLSWQSLRLRLADVRPLQQRVGLEALHVDGAVLHLRRDGFGRLELQQLMAARTAPAPTPTPIQAPALASSAQAASTPASGAAAAMPPPAGWQIQLALLELNAARLNWSDAAVQPAAELQLDGIGVRMKSLRWPVDGDATLQLAAQLVAAGQPVGQLRAEGTLTDRQARIAFQASDVELAAASPYLGQRLRPQLAARLGTDGELDWAAGATPRLALTLAKLRVDDFKLADKAIATRTRAKALPAALAQWQRLELSDVRVDLLQHRVGIGTLSLQQPFIDLARDATGALNAGSWLVEGDAATPAPAPAPAAAAASTGPAPPWSLTLRELKVEAGSARLADAALPAGPLRLGDLRLLAQGLAWPLAPGAAPMTTQLSASLSVPGPRAGTSAAAGPSRLDWRGRVSAQPPGANGQLRLERFPVHVFEPYFGAQLPVALRRLEAGFQGQVEVQQLSQGLSARLRGDALLADLRIVARDGGAAAPPATALPERELLTWTAMALGGVDAALQPGTRPRVEIGELRISDYYSRLEITEEGRFNLQTVAAAPPRGGAPAAGQANTPAAAAGPASAAATAGAAPAVSATPGAEVSAPVAMLSGLPVDLIIGSTQFSNGRVDFNDRFVRPNYRAELTELNGRIGRLDSRSRDMATLQFGGRVAGTGQLEIGGAVNPTVVPPALDIKAKALDIDLSDLTPYSSKYAGYPIERGRLSVDVAYKVDADGKLEANNQIIVHQLTFGAKTDSPDATKLPVPLIVALLQDKNGVIDLDIPLTGSLADPKFNLGALIWKVIVNLFTKAASSPFSVIGGGGKDLSRVDFRPGTAQIADASQEVITKVAKALDDRPGLKLGIVAMADPVSERQAMQQAAFDARVLAEQRRERARGSLGAAAADAAPPPLSADERAALVKQIYADTRLPDKPRNLIGMAKDIPVAEMEAMLVAAMPADDAAARQLAVQRGRTVREALMAKGLGSERLFVGEAKLRSEAADNAPWVPQAQLTLSAN